jgi:hypothetical protein
MVRESSKDVSEWNEAVIKQFRLELSEEHLDNLALLPRSGRDYGLVKFYSPDSTELLTAEILQLPDKNAFLKFVRDSSSTREVQIHGTLRTWAKLPSRSLAKGLPETSRWVVYEKGICLIGLDESVRSVDFDAIHAFYEQAAQSHYSVRISAEGIPTSVREKLIGATLRKANPKLQRRNSEPLSDYIVRKHLGQHGLSVLESALGDLSQFTVHIRYPDLKKKSGFETVIQLEAVPDSNLDKYLQGLTPESPAFVLRNPSSHALAAEMHLSIPKIANEALRAIKAGLPSDDGTLWAGCLRSICAGRIDFGVVIPAEKSEPEVILATGFESSVPLSAGKLPLTPNGTTGSLTWKLEQAADWPELAGMELLAVRQPGRLFGILSTHDGRRSESFNDRIGSVDEVLTKVNRAIVTPVLEVQADLSKLGDIKSDDIPEILLVLERGADELFRLERRLKFEHSMKGAPRGALRHLEKHFGAPTVYLADFESALGDRESWRGDWTASVRVVALKGRVTGKIKVGFDLYSLYKARRLLAATRLLDSR